MTLGCSRMSVRLLVFESRAGRATARASLSLARACLRVVVPDKLAECVLRPNIYSLSPIYPDVRARNGVVALPCRVGDPDRKDKNQLGRRPTKKMPL